MGTAAGRLRSRSRPRPRPGRRRLPRQALADSAWKLAAACAGIFALAFFGALSISFFLRPTKRYIFPLLSDIDSLHPESAILRSGTFLATVLLCATAAAVCATVSGPSTSASAFEERATGGSGLARPANTLNVDVIDVLSTDSDVSDDEFDELRDTDGFEDGESLLYVGGDTSATLTAKPASHQETNRILRRLRHQVAVATRTNRRALFLVFALVVLLVMMLYQGGLTRLSAARDKFEEESAETMSSAPIAPGSNPNATRSDSPTDAKSTLPELGASPGAIVALYAFAVIWTALLMFLVWFFLRLQSTASTDLPPPSVSPEDGVSLDVSDADGPVQGSSSFMSLPSLSVSNLTLSSMSSSISSLSTTVSSLSASLRATVENLSAMGADEFRTLVLERSRAFWWRLIAAVRPICLIAQVVSAIKIAGLLYALNFFRIAEIGLINTTLLAALAFAEYSAAFFVSFFLIVLAVDLRSAAEDELWVSRLQIGTSCL